MKEELSIKQILGAIPIVFLGVGGLMLLFYWPLSYFDSKAGNMTLIDTILFLIWLIVYIGGGMLIFVGTLFGAWEIMERLE